MTCMGLEPQHTPGLTAGPGTTRMLPCYFSNPRRRAAMPPCPPRDSRLVNARPPNARPCRPVDRCPRRRAVRLPAQQGPAQGHGAVPVTVVTLRSADGHAGTRAAGPHQRLPGRRSAAAGRAASCKRGCSPRAAGHGRPAAVPARRRDLSRRVRQCAKAALARAEATCEAARLRASASPSWPRSARSASRTTKTPMAALGQAEADVGRRRAALDCGSVMLGYARITAPITRPHRQVRGHPGRAGHRGPGRRRWPPCSSSTRSTLTRRSRAPNCCSCKPRTGRGRTRAGRRPAGHDPARGRHRLRHDGKLEFSEVSVDPTTGSYALRVKVPNPDHLLLPGMYVRAVVGSGVRPRTRMLVPAAGHRPRSAGRHHRDGRRQGRQGRGAPGQGQPQPSATSGWWRRACRPATG